MTNFEAEFTQCFGKKRFAVKLMYYVIPGLILTQYLAISKESGQYRAHMQ